MQTDQVHISITRYEITLMSSMHAHLLLETGALNVSLNDLQTSFVFLLRGSLQCPRWTNEKSQQVGGRRVQPVQRAQDCRLTFQRLSTDCPPKDGDS